MDIVRKIYTAVIALALAGFCPAYGQADSAAVPAANRAFEAVHARDDASRFVGFAFENPAIKGFQWSSSLSDMAFAWDYRDEDEAFVIQEGTGGSHWSLSADSYKIIDGRNVVWGGARYKRGKVRNVSWNHSSDYSVLYPYVTIDTLALDRESEEYGFNGGYFHRFGRVAAGLQGDLRAMQEYRDRDPRPRNITIDLHLSAGVSAELGGKYRAGASFMFRKYKQSGDVGNNDVLGSVTSYKWGAGMGAIMSDFLSKGSASTLYRGHAYGASMDVVPVGASGFHARVSYDRFVFERVAQSVGDKVPGNKMIHQTVNAEGVYRMSIGRFDLGAGVGFTHRFREGIETIIANTTANNYAVLGRLSRYEERASDYSVRLRADYRWAGYTLGLEPRAAISSSKVRYVGDRDPSAMIIRYKEVGLRFSLAKRWDGTLLQCGVGVNRHIDGDGELRLPTMVAMDNEMPGSFDMMHYVFSRYSSDYTTYDANVRVDFPAWKKNTIFVSAAWTRGDYKQDLISDTVSLTVGMSF